MSSFLDDEVEEASSGEEVPSDAEDKADLVRSGSKKKAGKNRSRVIDSSEEDEDDGESLR